MLRRFQHPTGWPTLAPLACAVHCAATPAIVAFAPWLSTASEVEWSFLGATVVFGAISLPPRLRSLGDPRPTLLLLAGVGVWALSLLRLLEPIPEPLTTTVAALVAACGLYWNARLNCAVSRGRRG